MKKEQEDEPIVEVKYYDDGSKKSETTFVNGVENGEYKSWYYGGKKLAWTGHYKNGLMDGEWREYDDYTGRLLGRETYKNGKLHGRLTGWDTRGTRIEDKLYLNGHMVKDMFDDDACEWLAALREIFE